jgi:anthranilate phosphoribosyltransferase
MSSALQKLLLKADLSREEARSAMLEIMEGKYTPAQIAAFLVALRMKGETLEEITGFAEAMREKMTRVSPQARPLVDTCGTGGDGARTFNISTAAAFVAAGAGAAIAKHGNRAVSSPCGSADVLEALGVTITLTPQQIADCIDAVGIGFMFAPGLHPAMKYAAPVRKELGVRTVFNLLGPLANPASAQAQVLGVYASALTEAHAGVLKNLGSRRALVVHGLDGLDEITTTGPTQISELIDGEVNTYHFSAEDYGLTRAEPGDLAGGADPGENARILLAVLEGKPGPRRDIVLLNAAAALLAADIVKDFRQGLALAAEAIDSGRARAKLQALQAYTGELSPKTE